MHQCVVTEPLSSLDISSDESGASAGEGRAASCVLLEPVSCVGLVLAGSWCWLVLQLVEASVNHYDCRAVQSG